MAKSSNNGGTHQSGEPRGTVKRVEDLLAARQARNEHSLHNAAEVVKATADRVRQDQGKAISLQLDKQFEDAVQIGLAEGTEDGLNQFFDSLPEKVAQVKAALRNDHAQMIGTIDAEGQARLGSADVIEAEYREVDVNSLFGDDDAWLTLPSSGSNVPQLAGSDKEEEIFDF